MATTRAPEHRLDGWNVLVTRPAGMGDALATRLRDAGAHVDSSPLLEIVPLNEGRATPAAVLALDHFDIVIVTSRNAAIHGMLLLSRHWPRLPDTGQRWLAVGAATAAVLASWHVTAEAPGDERSEGLLALPALAAVSGMSVLLLTGEGGRGLIEETLQARGATVVRLPVYQRRRSAAARRELDALHHAQGRRAVLVTSVDALHNLLVLAPWLPASNVHLIAGSQRIAAAAAANGVRHVTVADGADDERMLAALTQLATQIAR